MTLSVNNHNTPIQTPKPNTDPPPKKSESYAINEATVKFNKALNGDKICTQEDFTYGNIPIYYEDAARYFEGSNYKGTLYHCGGGLGAYAQSYGECGGQKGANGVVLRNQSMPNSTGTETVLITLNEGKNFKDNNIEGTLVISSDMPRHFNSAKDRLQAEANGEPMSYVENRPYPFTITVDEASDPVNSQSFQKVLKKAKEDGHMNVFNDTGIHLKNN